MPIHVAEAYLPCDRRQPIGDAVRRQIGGERRGRRPADPPRRPAADQPGDARVWLLRPGTRAVTPLDRLGAVVTKTQFPESRAGNRAPRIADTGYGVLNSVGIPSPGVARFRADVLPRYLAIGVPVIVSVGGLAIDDYFRVVEDLAGDPIDAFEVNVSCPNLERGGVAIGADPAQVDEVTCGVVARAGGRPVIVKLTPNLASIVTVAAAAQRAGASAVTVANTFVGLAVDVHNRCLTLGNGTGGVSGPGVKPLVLRLVWQAAKAVDVPVIASGGVCDVTDALEYLLVGASAVQVGTVTFSRPGTMTEIIDQLPARLQELGCRSVTELVGSVRQ